MKIYDNEKLLQAVLWQGSYPFTQLLNLGVYSMRKSKMVLLAVVLLGGIGMVLLVSRTTPVSDPSMSIPSSLECVEDGAPRGLVGCIRNEDIQWRRTYDGLDPQLSGATVKLLKTQEDIEPMLLEALRDDKKFVAAHVLLVYRSSSEFAIWEDIQFWYGLQVHFEAGGQASYGGNDLAQLYQRWKSKLQQ